MLTCPPVTVVRDLAGLRACLPAYGDTRHWAVDFETFGTTIRWRGKSGPNPLTHKIAGIGIGTLDALWYIDVRHALGPFPHCGLLAVKAWLESLFAWGRATKRLWAWNLGYELQICRNEGVDYGAFSDDYNDASISGWLAGWGNKPALKATAQRLFPELGELSDFSDTFGKDADMSQFTAEQVAPYGGKDPWLTLLLAQRSMEILEARSLVDHYRNIDMPMVEPLRDMQAFGVGVDRPLLEALRTRKRAEAEALALEFKAKTTTEVEIAARIPMPVMDDDGMPVLYKSGKRKGEVKTKLEDSFIDARAGADIGSDQQVSRWVYDELALWPTIGLKKNKTGAWPVDKDTVEPFQVLPGLAGELATTLLAYRRADKLCSTYLDVMLETPAQWGDGRLHPAYHLNGTVTQRLSSSGPNFQNVPAHSEDAKVISAAIVSPPGWKFVVYDLSQIELRIMAHVSRDPALVEAYMFGEDVHARTLATVRKTFPTAQRVNAKITNFCLNPSTPVLTSDLRWVPAGTIEVGAKLVGFDEVLGNTCRYREAVVSDVTQFEAECVEVVTERGALVVSADHGFVAGVVLPGNRVRRAWVKAQDLQTGQVLAHMVDPWERLDDRDTGWLAGFFDGEGFVSKGGVVGFGQNAGPTRDRANLLLEERGFDIRAQQNTVNRCIQSQIRGYGENLRLVGQVRPERLLAKPKHLWLGKRPYGPYTIQPRVLSVRRIGLREVVGHQTTTRTLVAGGFLTHNSTIYDISAESLAIKLKSDVPTAQAFIDAFYATHGQVSAAQERLVMFAAKHGYATTIDGFRHYFQFPKSPHTRRKAINFPIQGSAGGTIKLAQRNLHRHWVAAGRYGKDVRFCGQVHDALYACATDEFAEEAAIDMERCMTTAVTLRLPTEAEGGIGRSWAEAKK